MSELCRLEDGDEIVFDNGAQAIDLAVLIFGWGDEKISKILSQNPKLKISDHFANDIWKNLGRLYFQAIAHGNRFRGLDPEDPLRVHFFAV